MNRLIFILAHQTARERALAAVAEAPEGYVVEIRERTRNLEQNARLHAMLDDVSRQCAWMGRRLSADQWKVLFVSGHAIATKEGADMVPGLEGEFCNLRESTARMGVKRMSSLIEYVQAWGDDNGVEWTDGK